MNYFQRTRSVPRDPDHRAGDGHPVPDAGLHAPLRGAELKDMGDFNWWREAPVPYLNFLFWGAAHALVYSILKRWPFHRRPLARSSLIHVGLSLLIGAFHEVVTSTVYYGILDWRGDFDFSEPMMRNWAVHALPRHPQPLHGILDADGGAGRPGQRAPDA